MFKTFYSRLFAAVILCCIGFIIYSNTFGNSFQFDDEKFIVENPAVRNPFNLISIWSFWSTRFITFLSFAFNFRMGDLNVFGYHLFNLIIHLCSAILVYWLVLMIFDAPTMNKEEISAYSYWAAFLSAAIFLTHPLQTESVTYIFQRSTSLCGFFCILSLCLYAKSRLLQIKDYPMGRRMFLYFLSWLMCMAAMFTKENAVILPLIITLYELYFLKTGKHIEWRYILPFLITLPVIPATLFFYKPLTFGDAQKMISSPMAAGGYLLTQFKVILTYFRLLFIPLNQNLDYDYGFARSLFELPVLFGVLFLVLIVFIAIRSFKRQKLISFAIFWFFLTLLPESSIIPLKDAIFEHRLYLPMVSYSIFLVTVMYYIIGKKSMFGMAIILVMLINWYALLTYTRNIDWLNAVTLWDDTVRKSPHKPRPYFNRGLAYADAGEYKKAFSDFSKSLMLYYKQIGKNQDYSQDYKKLIMLDQSYAELFNFLGVQYAGINLPEHATILFKKSIEIYPSNIQYYANLCAAYGELKRYKDAIRIGEKGIALNSNSASVHYNLAVAYYFDNQFVSALKHLEIATKLGFTADPEFVTILKKK
jgi:tetratricopeptide (TPR) repeat protein